MQGKGFISEGDVALLLRRYTASTLLALLQEIFNTAESKLEWTTLMKTSNCGINNARECQNLWRHLAYRANLQESFEDDMEPLEDDSDLEFEVEPLPGVSPEVAANVAACVKVLAVTGSTANPSIKSQEPCFVIDIPNSSSGWEVRGNGQISNVIIQGAHTPETQPARKKRKLWTSEEDQELIAAVEKCGEGNWATMLKGAFRHERTAAQLSQRWALIRKRRDSQSGAGQNNIVDNQAAVTGTTPAAGSQLPMEVGNLLATAEGQKVATSAGTSGAGNTGTMLTGIPKIVSLPVSHEQNGSSGNTSCIPSVPQSTGKGRPPVKKNGVFGSQLGRSANSIANGLGSSSGPNANGVGDIRSAKAANAASASLATSSSVPGRFSAASSGLRNNAMTSVGRPVSKSLAGPDPMVQAAAVAAGARIAPASAAASLLKAAHSGNVVHIGPGGVSVGKAGAQSQSSNVATSSVKVGSGVGSRSSAGTLVHYIRTGTGSPQSLHLTSQRASQAKSQSTKSGIAQSTRSGALTLPSPGLPGVSSSSMQKSSISPLSSGLKVKASLSSEVRGMIAIDATTAKPLDRIDGSSPLSSEEMVKKTIQEFSGKIATGPLNGPAESASGLPTETTGIATNMSCHKPESQDSSEKASLFDNSDVVGFSNVMGPIISVQGKGDLPGSLAATEIYDNSVKSSSINSPKGDDPE